MSGVYDGPVAAFCGWLWEARQAKGSAVRGSGRELAAVCARQVEELEGYDPEEDNRVKWAREVIASAKRGDVVPRATLGLEASMEFLREPCGKLLAAGGGGSAE